MNENEWMEIREDSLNYIRNLHENALKKYLGEIGLVETFAYDYDHSANKFTIYTNRPGIWIGKGGAGVDRLKQILSEEVKEGCDIEFKHIRGHFVTPIKEWAVVCYSGKDEYIVSCNTFNNEEEAIRFLEEDAKKTYNDEYQDVHRDDRENVKLTMKEKSAILTSYNGDRVFNWEIIEVLQ